MTKDDEIDGGKLPGWNLAHLDYPTFRLSLLAKVIDRLSIRALAANGQMTYAQWRVLVRLGSLAKGATHGQIADLAWSDRAEVSRAVSALESRGLIDRHENPADRRTPILRLSPAGKKEFETGIAKRRAFHEELLSGMSSEDRAQFDALLGRVGERLQEMVEDS